VLYAHVESGDPVHEPVFSILNPFRDHASERAAGALLDDLRHGEYGQGLSRIEDPNARKNEIETHERAHRLQAWKLMNRVDHGMSTRLFYRARREKSGSDVPMWIVVERDGDRWRVRSYETWY
jgi:hypothetical protein